eukprot:1530_1
MSFIAKVQVSTNCGNGLFMQMIYTDYKIHFIWLLLLVTMQVINGAQLTFKPSETNVADEYCIDEFSWSVNVIDVTGYCADIDSILIHYCGNVTLFRIFDENYNETHDSNTTSLCEFFLEDEQIINKTYLLSDNIPINHIIFSSKPHLLNHENETNILLSQSFLSIESYEGSVDIVNIDFTSDGSIFSLIDVAANDFELNITINRCQCVDMNGSIINMPNNMISSGYTKIINVQFESCVMNNVNAEYGAILHIERNNVEVTFSNLNVTNITSTADGSGAAVHWICQNKNGTNLCGDLLIIESDFYILETNVFTIDLSMDPSEVYFILEVDTSYFDNIDGVIFNFNHNNDSLAHTNKRIQAQNAFINVKNSNFSNNGLKTEA